MLKFFKYSELVITNLKKKPKRNIFKKINLNGLK